MPEKAVISFYFLCVCLAFFVCVARKHSDEAVPMKIADSNEKFKKQSFSSLQLFPFSKGLRL